MTSTDSGTTETPITASCVRCSSPVFDGERFCEACGTPVTPAADGPPGPASGDDGSGRGLPADGRRRVGPAARPDVDLPTVGTATDVGLRRHRNEDAAAAVADDRGSAAVVCDGVASTGNAHLAARAAADVTIDVVGRGVEDVEDADGATALLVRAFAAAQDAVSGVVTEVPGSMELAPSTTIVAALAVDDVVVVANIGDSRAYWLGATGPPALLTADDSLAQDRIAEGTPAEVAFADPDGHTITRWLGADADGGAPRVSVFPVTGPGWVVLCTDGLWNYAEEPERLAEAAGDPTGTSPGDVARRLVRFALGAGGQDNVTVAVLAIAVPEGVDDGSGRSEGV